MSALGGGVGSGGANNVGDVRLIQRLLNDHLARTSQTLLVVDGKSGPKTVAAITAFQKANGLVADGRVDRGGATLKKLMSAHLQGLSDGIKPFKVPKDQKPLFDTATTTDAFAVYWQKLKQP